MNFMCVTELGGQSNAVQGIIPLLLAGIHSSASRVHLVLTMVDINVGAQTPPTSVVYKLFWFGGRAKASLQKSTDFLSVV